MGRARACLEWIVGGGNSNIFASYSRFVANMYIGHELLIGTNPPLEGYTRARFPGNASEDGYNAHLLRLASFGAPKVSARSYSRTRQ